MDKPRSSDSNQLSATARVNHAAWVSSDFAALFEDETDTDVVIKVGDAKFPVHRIVLKARCGYLNKKVVENLPHHELELTDTSPHVFKKMLQYIYTGKLTFFDLNWQDTLDQFQLAVLYGFSRLQSSIGTILTQEVTKENAVAMLEYVIAHPNRALENLEQNALRCIVSRGVEFLENPEFVALSVDCVERLLRYLWNVPIQELNKALESWVENNGTTGEKLEQLLSAIKERFIPRIRPLDIPEFEARNVKRFGIRVVKMQQVTGEMPSYLSLPRKRLLGELLTGIPKILPNVPTFAKTVLETCAGIKAEDYTGRNSMRPGSSRDYPSPLGIAFASDANCLGNPSKMKTTEHTLDEHFDLIINDPDDEVDPETASSSNAVLETRAETASCSFFEKRLNIAQQEKCRPIFQPGSLLDDPSPFKLILMSDPNRNENPNKMKTTDDSDEDEHEDWNEDLIFQLDDCGSNGNNEDWDHHFQMDLL